MFLTPSDKEIKKIVISEDTISNGAKPEIIRTKKVTENKKTNKSI